MKTFIIPVLLVLLTAALTAAGDGHHGGHGGRPERAEQLLAFDSMYAVDGPFLDPANAINGVEGDELPWEIGSAQGTLMTDGRLELHVRGLVFARDSEVPAHLQGKNDERTFRVLVSCLTEDDQDHIAPATVMSEGFDANVSGDSDIDTTLHLPNPCIAPVVFVMSGSEHKWFAVTGFEAERD